MTHGFSDGVRTALVRAAGEAQRLQSDEIAPEHLLLGLTWRSDDRTDAMWEGLGVDASLVYWRTMAAVETPDRSGSNADLPYTEPAREVLKRAMKEAEALGDPLVGTEHLLLALIIEGGVPAQVLSSLGVTLTDARQLAGWRGTSAPGRVLREFRGALRQIAEELKRSDPAV
jgi:ATP-dependent Clp protease ATP-binding subunit ClpC